MVTDGYRSAGPAQLEGWVPTAWTIDTRTVSSGRAAATRDDAQSGKGAKSSDFQLSARVKIDGLQGAPQYNGYTGKVVEVSADGRFGVEIIFKAARKRLSLKPENLEVHDEPSPKRQAGPSPMSALLESLKQDPDVIAALENPKCKEAYDDVLANGMMAGMKYLGDPDCAPVIQRVAAKMGMADMIPGAAGR